MKKQLLVSGAVAGVLVLIMSGLAVAQVVFTKAQVADRIRKVEDGVDEFRKWAENRGEQAKNTSQAAKSSSSVRPPVECNSGSGHPSRARSASECSL